MEIGIGSKILFTFALLVGVIVAFSIIWGNQGYIERSMNESKLRNNFCQSDLIITDGGYLADDLYYCDGKQFVCSDTKCYWVN